MDTAATTVRTRPHKHAHRLKKAISHLRKPEEMSLEQWQVALRKQVASQQKFKIENVGDEPVFSEFQVLNPETKRTYRVAIRGLEVGDNYCSCPDYAVNTLGTCKHIEHVLRKLRRTPEGKRGFKEGYWPEFSEIYLQYGAQRHVRFRRGKFCPNSVWRAAAGISDRSGNITPGNYTAIRDIRDAAAREKHEVRVHADAVAYMAQVLSQESTRLRIKKTLPKGADDPAFGKLLKVTLYPYQRQGALFAAMAGRCLIADEMGLGKTIQAIAAAEILARCGGVERVLIVCPTSLKQQWASELSRFTGRSLKVIEGFATSRDAAYAADSCFKIVNYDVLHRDIESLRKLKPDLLILDEAQRIKNWRTRAAKTVKQIDSPYAIVLTGTPLENRLEELHSIVEMVDRFRLGPLFRFVDAHQKLDKDGRVVGYHRLDEINKTLAPVMIRRTKAQVLSQLPPRMEKLLLVPMTAEQQRIHADNEQEVANLVHKWRKRGFLIEAEQLRLRICLQMMRMCCDSTYLVDQETNCGNKVAEFATQLGEVLEHPDAKVVVFSQWLRMHELVQRELKERAIGHVLFHGQVPGAKRGELVRQFKQDADCRVFLSTDAGGVGLNLQHACAVVNLDLPWNPAVLEQRIGRVHRLGQTRPVHVLNFVAEGTIEHRILNLLQFKKSLFAGAIDGTEAEVSLNGGRLKQFMEAVEKATTGIPAPTPQAEPEAKAESSQTPVEEAPSAAAAEPGAKPLAKRGEALAGSGDALLQLVNAGRSLLDALAQAVSASPSSGSHRSARVEQDSATGERYLRVALPSPDKLKGILEAVTQLLPRR